MSVPFQILMSPTADDTFLDHMSVDDLIRFQRISSLTRDIVLSYIRRRFKVTDFISPFIPLDFLHDFRMLMAQTNMIISGSVPLQFFLRTPWDGSDLDLYVDSMFTATVCTWLVSHDFQFQPQYEGHLWQHSLPSSTFPCRADELVFSPSSILTYVQFGRPHTVLNFKNTTSGRLIQVVPSRGTPIQCILNFHSTIVVNFFTHDMAYAIFPKATLVHKHGVEQRFSGLQHLPTALNKYRSRGFRISPRATSHQAFGLHASLPFGRRSPGDSLSWTIPWETRLPLPTSTIDCNSWILSYQPDLTLQYSAILCMSKRLRFSYLLEPGITEVSLQKNWRALQAAHPGSDYLDHLFRSLLPVP